MTKQGAQPDAVLPIVALVREVVASSPYPDVAAYARAHGISRSTLNRYHNHLHEPMASPPRRSTLVALARALGRPLSEVERAADASVDRTSRQETSSEPTAIGAAPSVLDAIRDDPHLLPEAKSHLLNQYGLLLRLSSPPAAPTPEEHAVEAEAQAAILAHSAKTKRTATRDVRGAP